MSTSDIQETKLSWILKVAERVSSYFKSESDTIFGDVEKVIKHHKAVYAKGVIASDGYTYMIICNEPMKLLEDIVEQFRSANSRTYQTTLNPITIIQKLINQEFIFDVNGTRLCYAVKSSVASNYLLKTIACKNIYSIHNFNSYIDAESNTMDVDKIKELHPLYDYSINANRALGGRKKAFTPNQKKKGNIRVDIISRLFEYVRNTPAIAQGIVFINKLDECSSSAVNVLFTELKYKNAMVDYLKLLIAETYKNYTFKSFLHADFSVPYDFRMRKISCVINDKDTKQPTYIANMYNIATYTPIPCVKQIIGNKFIQEAHPIIKLMMLFIDMYMIEHKTNTVNPASHEQVYLNKMIKAFNEVQTFDKSPNWVGIFIEEAYEKNKYNTRMKMSTPITNMLI